MMLLKVLLMNGHIDWSHVISSIFIIVIFVCIYLCLLSKIKDIPSYDTHRVMIHVQLLNQKCILGVGAGERNKS